MNTYSRKQVWKLMLFFAAIIIGVGSMWYTNKLVTELSREERKKVELWAEATKQLIMADFDQEVSFLTRIIQSNETVPVILVDEQGNIISSANLDSTRTNNEKYMRRQLEKMKDQHPPIEYEIPNVGKNIIYYKDSVILTKLSYYPFIQLSVISLFILVSYLVFSTSRKAEQNQVWVGLSKETAHQLGTPISSLIAWIELLKLKEEDKVLVAEVEKDVKRLETITERFSKIGSAPVMTKTNIVGILNNSVNYVKNRSSDRVVFEINFAPDDETIVPLNVALFEWVIENLCKNAIDAMNGSGIISVSLTDHIQVIYIDISDTGKGIPKSKYKTIFQPGFTTKKRGWGLGLSLAKRIIEIYHSGKIFVKNSEINVGTTFRIVLKK